MRPVILPPGCAKLVTRPELRWPERITAKFAAGTLDRIAAVLAKGEVRLDFIRTAIEHEIQRRESTKPIKRGHR
jgi:hypothetical protein